MQGAGEGARLPSAGPSQTEETSGDATFGEEADGGGLPPPSAIYDLPTSELIILGKKLQRLLSESAGGCVGMAGGEARERHQSLLRCLVLELRERHLSLRIRSSLQRLAPSQEDQQSNAPSEEAAPPSPAGCVSKAPPASAPFGQGAGRTSPGSGQEAAAAGEDASSDLSAKTKASASVGRPPQAALLARRSVGGERHEELQQQLLLPLLLQKKRALRRAAGAKKAEGKKEAAAGEPLLRQLRRRSASLPLSPRPAATPHSATNNTRPSRGGNIARKNAASKSKSRSGESAAAAASAPLKSSHGLQRPKPLPSQGPRRQGTKDSRDFAEKERIAPPPTAAANLENESKLLLGARPPRLAGKASLLPRLSESSLRQRGEEEATVQVKGAECECVSAESSAVVVERRRAPVDLPKDSFEKANFCALGQPKTHRSASRVSGSESSASHQTLSATAAVVSGPSRSFQMQDWQAAVSEPRGEEGGASQRTAKTNAAATSGFCVSTPRLCSFPESSCSAADASSSFSEERRFAGAASSGGLSGDWPFRSETRRRSLQPTPGVRAALRRGAEDSHANIRCCAQSMVGSLSETLRELASKAFPDGGLPLRRVLRWRSSSCSLPSRKSRSSFFQRTTKPLLSPSRRRRLFSSVSQHEVAGEGRTQGASDANKSLLDATRRPGSPNSQLRDLLREVCGESFEILAGGASQAQTAAAYSEAPSVPNFLLTNKNPHSTAAEPNSPSEEAIEDWAAQDGASLDTVYAILKSISTSLAKGASAAEGTEAAPPQATRSSCLDTPASGSVDSKEAPGGFAEEELEFPGEEPSPLEARRPHRGAKASFSERPRTAGGPSSRARAAILIPLHLEAPLTLSRRRVLRRLNPRRPSSRSGTFLSAASQEYDSQTKDAPQGPLQPLESERAERQSFDFPLSSEQRLDSGDVDVDSREPGESAPFRLRRASSHPPPTPHFCKKEISRCPSADPWAKTRPSESGGERGSEVKSEGETNSSSPAAAASEEFFAPHKRQLAAASCLLGRRRREEQTSGSSAYRGERSVSVWQTKRPSVETPHPRSAEERRVVVNVASPGARALAAAEANSQRLSSRHEAPPFSRSASSLGSSFCNGLVGSAAASAGGAGSSREEESLELSGLLRLVSRDASLEGLVSLRQLAHLLQQSKRELFAAQKQQRVKDDPAGPLRTFACEDCDCEEEASLAEALHSSGGWVLVRGPAASKTCNLRWIGKQGASQRSGLGRNDEAATSDGARSNYAAAPYPLKEKTGRCRLPFFLQVSNRMQGVEHALDLRRVFRLQNRFADAAGGTLQRFFDAVPPTLPVPLKRRQLLEETSRCIQVRGREPLWLCKGQKGQRRSSSSQRKRKQTKTPLQSVALEEPKKRRGGSTHACLLHAGAFWEGPASAQRILVGISARGRSDGNKSGLLQLYIDEPLLLRRRKFSLKLFVVLTACRPLEAFVYQEGVCHVARLPFSMEEDALANPFVHRTNCLPSTFVGSARDLLPGFPRRSSSSCAEGKQPRALVGKGGGCDGGASDTSDGAASASLDSTTGTAGDEDGHTRQQFFALHQKPREKDKEQRRDGREAGPPKPSACCSRGVAAPEQRDKGRSSAGPHKDSLGVRLTFQQLREILLLEENGVPFEKLWKSACTAVLQVLLLAAPQLRSSSPGFAVLAFSVVFDKRCSAKVTKVECDARLEGSRRQRRDFLKSLVALVNPHAFCRTELAEAILAALPEARVLRGVSGKDFKSLLAAASSLTPWAHPPSPSSRRSKSLQTANPRRRQDPAALFPRGRTNRDAPCAAREGDLLSTPKASLALLPPSLAAEDASDAPSLAWALAKIHVPGVSHRSRAEALPRAFDEDKKDKEQGPKAPPPKNGLMEARAAAAGEGAGNFFSERIDVYFERLAPSRASVRLQSIAAHAGVLIG